jgi:hypothetical protein
MQIPTRIEMTEMHHPAIKKRTQPKKWDKKMISIVGGVEVRDRRK